MSTLVIVILGLLLLVGVGALIFIRSRRGEESSVDGRMDRFGTMSQPTLQEIEMSQPFSERVLLPMLEKLSQFAVRFTPKKSMEEINHKLELAGRPYGWNATQFLGVRLFMTILLGGLGVFLLTMVDMTTSRRFLLLGALVGMGYFLPILFLRSMIQRRQDAIQKALPDALDLLTICVEAGLGFDAAMSKVANKWDDELSESFRRVIQELQLGKSRRAALRGMADRTGVRDVSTFVAAIIQADQLGVSMAKVLHIQSDQMRMRRRQRAEALANQAGIKMLPAIAFLIFPSIFIILLGPAVIQVKDMFGGGGIGLP